MCVFFFKKDYKNKSKIGDTLTKGAVLDPGSNISCEFMAKYSNLEWTR